MLMNLLCGGVGCIDGPPCMSPEPWLAVWDAYQAGDMARAQAAQDACFPYKMVRQPLHTRQQIHSHPIPKLFGAAGGRLCPDPSLLCTSDLPQIRATGSAEMRELRCLCLMLSMQSRPATGAEQTAMLPPQVLSMKLRVDLGQPRLPNLPLEGDRRAAMLAEAAKIGIDGVSSPKL